MFDMNLAYWPYIILCATPTLFAVLGIAYFKMNIKQMLISIFQVFIVVLTFALFEGLSQTAVFFFVSLIAPFLIILWSSLTKRKRLISDKER